MNENLRIASLEAQLAEATKKIEDLEQALGVNFGAPLQFGLTKNEAIIFGVLMHRKLASKAALWLAIYSSKSEDDEADIKIIDVWVCKMRPKLREFEIEIKTAWGQGYYLTDEDKKSALRYFDVTGPTNALTSERAA